MKGKATIVAGLIVIAACMVGIGSTRTLASYPGTGVGIQLGEPTGLTLKSWQDEVSAVQLAGAWSFIEPPAFTAQIDYLIHSPMEDGSSYTYYGIGGRIKFEEDESRLGVRVPLGLNYLIDGAPIDVFIELAPILDLAPKTEFTAAGAVGVRYFFD